MRLPISVRRHAAILIVPSLFYCSAITITQKLVTTFSIHLLLKFLSRCRLSRTGKRTPRCLFRCFTKLTTIGFIRSIHTIEIPITYPLLQNAFTNSTTISATSDMASRTLGTTVIKKTVNLTLIK